MLACSRNCTKPYSSRYWSEARVTQGPLFDAIAERSKTFTDAQQRIAEFVLRHMTQVAFLNARELGEAVGTSESSVIRFAYSAGFDGYRALQSAAQEMVNSQLTMRQRFLQRHQTDRDVVATTIRNDIKNLEALGHSLSSSEVERAAAHIAGARRCYVVGFRGAAGLALIASGAINQLRHNGIQLSLDSGDAVDLLVGAGPDDCLLAISFRRYAHRTLRIARFARQRGMFVIAVTDGLFSPLRECSNVLLTAEVESPNYCYSLSAPLSVINSLILALSQQMGSKAADLIRDWEETYRQFDLLEGLNSTGGD